MARAMNSIEMCRLFDTQTRLLTVSGKRRWCSLPDRLLNLFSLVLVGSGRTRGDRAEEGTARGRNGSQDQLFPCLPKRRRGTHEALDGGRLVASQHLPTVSIYLAHVSPTIVLGVAGALGDHG